MRLVQTFVCLLMIASCGLIGGIESSKKFNSWSSICPADCRCITTVEGLHKAVCFNLQALHKYTLLNKHHNVNIIDLSNSNITRINDELDGFTEIVALDLSGNSLKTINKFLTNSKKLVHLNLRNNELRTFSASAIPSSVSSLDLQNNSLTNLPSEIHILKDLEHLQLEDNPLNCSCENLNILNALKRNKVLIDDVKCVTPKEFKNIKWSQLNKKNQCPNQENLDTKANGGEVMLADEPTDDDDPENDLNAGQIFEAVSPDDHDTDEDEYLPTASDKPRSSNEEPFEASGDLDEASRSSIPSLEDASENDGSGDGSGDHIDYRISPQTSDDYEEEGSGDMENETITTSTESLFMTGFLPILLNTNSEENNNTNLDNDDDLPLRPNIFAGDINWDEDDPNENKTEEPPVRRKIPLNEKTPTKEGDQNLPKESDDKTVTETVTMEVVRKEDEIKESTLRPTTNKATWIIVGIIVAVLVGLILLTVIKNKRRKSKERRLMMRQQKGDIEKADKELVEMNKSLLGKPAKIVPEQEKKLNGKYEMVPTHEPHKNGNAEKNRNSLEIPKNTQNIEMQEMSDPVLNGNTLPSNIDRMTPDFQRPESLTPLNLTPPKNLNGYSDELYPNDYSPTSIPPDSGIVKIKLTETQKPKTPVLVTRSRSNAGDIIITPIENQSLPIKNT